MVNGWFIMDYQNTITRINGRSRLVLFLVMLTLSVQLVSIYKENTIMVVKKTSKRSNRVKPPENESPSQAFTRLASGRTNKAIKAISLIAQLTGTAYESTEIQQRVIVTALQASVEQVKEVFAGKSKSSDSFKLPD